MRIIHIINSSTVQAYYQFDLDPSNHSVFTLDQTIGTLPAKGSILLRLSFRPHHPIAYHKRAVCLILHRVCHYAELEIIVALIALLMH